MGNIKCELRVVWLPQYRFFNYLVTYMKEKSPRISNLRALKALSLFFYIAPKYWLTTSSQSGP
jgi:hypothetical protein